MHVQNHRLNVNHHYVFRFPVIGRSYLSVDYGRCFLQALTAQKIAINYVKHNKYWLRSKNIYSHSLVFWVKKSWVIQFISFDQYIHSQRRLKNQYRVQRELKKMYDIYIKNQKKLNLKISKITNHKIKKQKLYTTSDNRYIVDTGRLVLANDYFLNFNQSWTYTAEVESIFSYIRSTQINKMINTNKYNRLDIYSKRSLTPIDINTNYKQMFKLFVNQIRPRGARIGKFLKFEKKINLNHKKLLKNNVSFKFRVLRYIRHGQIMMWLNYIRYRISERSVYQIRQVVYSLERYTKSNKLCCSRLAYTFKW